MSSPLKKVNLITIKKRELKLEILSKLFLNNERKVFAKL